MDKFKYFARICAGDGRLYNGSFINVEVLPKTLPDNAVLIDEVPDGINDGHNYIWDGEKLTYSPAETTSEETNDVNA